MCPIPKLMIQEHTTVTGLFLHGVRGSYACANKASPLLTELWPQMFFRASLCEAIFGFGLQTNPPEHTHASTCSYQDGYTFHTHMCTYASIPACSVLMCISPEYNTTQHSTAEDDSCSRCRTFFSSQVPLFIS